MVRCLPANSHENSSSGCMLIVCHLADGVGWGGDAVCEGEKGDEACHRMAVEFLDDEMGALHLIARNNGVSVEVLVSDIAKHYLRSEGPKIIQYFSQLESYFSSSSVEK